MNILLPYCQDDYPLVVDLLYWMQRLGPCDGHQLILCGNPKMKKQTKFLSEIVDGVFSKVGTIDLPPKVPKGWPSGPNFYFSAMLQTVQVCGLGPFLWLEPDATPIREGWADTIEEEYADCKTPFMGSINKSADGKVTHFSGVGVYPENAWDYWKDYLPSNSAFDMVNRHVTVPLATNTTVIQNFWGVHGLPPTFKFWKSATDPINTLTPHHLNPDAVIFHRCKDSTLTNLLKQRRANK